MLRYNPSGISANARLDALQPARDIGRILIERALRLFEEMKATGWIEEARGALATASPV
jgi:hypothetical protein